MGCVHSIDYYLGSHSSPQETVDKGIQMTQKALTLNESYGQARGLLSFLYIAKREYEKSIAEGERAAALNPSDATVIGFYATSLHFAGRSEEAIPLFEKSIRLNPFGPVFVYLNLGNALQMTGRFEEAVSAYKKAIQRAPNYIWCHLMLAANYSKMGREKEARAEAEEVLRINPKFSLDFFAKTSLMKEQSLKENTLNALRKTGLK
jgi:adenylate cyclase